MEQKPRFANPTVLSPNICPAPLTQFVQKLPLMALANRVFGNEIAATEWMCAPALTLNGRRPIDILLTHPNIIENLLIRLESGVDI